MNKSNYLYLLTLTLLLGTIILTSCGGGGPDGEELLRSRCKDCHSLDTITQAGKSLAGWELNVDRMIFRGAKLDDVEREILIEYLAETYPE